MVWAARRMRGSSPSARATRRGLRRAEDEALQLVLIGGEVFDRPTRHAGPHGGLRYGGRDAQDQAWVKGLGNDVVRPEGGRGAAIGRRRHLAGLLAGQVGHRLDGGHLHGLIDLAGVDVQRTAKHEGEAQDVVDLVRIVAAPSGDDRVRTRGAHLLGPDLRLRIGQRQYDRFRPQAV
jgi:hypothetical protein